MTEPLVRTVRYGGTLNKNKSEISEMSGRRGVSVMQSKKRCGGRLSKKLSRVAIGLALGTGASVFVNFTCNLFSYGFDIALFLSVYQLLQQFQRREQIELR